MKKLVVVIVAAGLALALVTPLSAHDTSWAVQLRVSDVDGANGRTSTMFGTNSSVGNQVLSGPDETKIELICTGSSGTSRYNYYRQADQAPSTTLVWNLVVYAGTGFPVGESKQFMLSVWNPVGDAYDIANDPGFAVRLYKGSSLEYEFDPSLNGTSKATQWTKLYSISPGDTISDFRLVREPAGLPELPACVLALLGGSVPLISVLRRRR